MENKDSYTTEEITTMLRARETYVVAWRKNQLPRSGETNSDSQCRDLLKAEKNYAKAVPRNLASLIGEVMPLVPK